MIAIAASGGGSATKRQVVIPREPNAARSTYALLAGIPQHGSVLGYRKAPVTLLFFADLQCKESRQVMLGPLADLIRRFVRAGTLKIDFRSTETDTKGAGGWLEFIEQQSAALAAGKQGKLWNFVDVFFREQGPEFTGYVDEAFLDRIAQKAGVDVASWEANRAPAAWTTHLEADQALGKATRMNSTPSFLIGHTGGTRRPLLHFGLDEPGVFNQAIEELLRT